MMLPRKTLLRIALLCALLLSAALPLFVSGCTAGSAKPTPDPIVGSWTLQGTAAKSTDPTSAKYVLRAPGSTQTQQFLANGTYINPRGEKRTWKRLDAKTVELAGVQVEVLIKGTDMYETLGESTLHWTKGEVGIPQLVATAMPAAPPGLG